MLSKFYRFFYRSYFNGFYYFYVIRLYTPIHHSFRSTAIGTRELSVVPFNSPYYRLQAENSGKVLGSRFDKRPSHFMRHEICFAITLLAQLAKYLNLFEANFIRYDNRKQKIPAKLFICLRKCPIISFLQIKILCLVIHFVSIANTILYLLHSDI